MPHHGDTLKQLGFSVMVAEKPNGRHSVKRCCILSGRLSPATPAFFSYGRPTALRSRGRTSCWPTDVPGREGEKARKNWFADAYVLADRMTSACQNKKVTHRHSCSMPARNNPFERGGTRAVAGGGGLAPLDEKCRRACSRCSPPARPDRPHSDRLANNDDKSQFGVQRTLRKSCCNPARTRQVSPDTRPAGQRDGGRTVSPQADPGYFDKMVDGTFFERPGEGQPEAAKPAARGSRVAACRRCFQVPRDAKKMTSVQWPDRDVLAHQWRMDRGVPIADPNAGDFVAGWAIAVNSEDRVYRPLRSAHPHKRIA